MNTWYQAIKKDQEAVDRNAAENIAKGGKAAETVYKYGTQTVAAVPQAVAAMLTGGASAAASTANLAKTAANALSPSLARTVSGAVSGMAKNPQYWSSFAQVVGPGYQQALADGADHAHATLYAVGNGLANAAVEIGGGVQRLPSALQGGEKVWKAVVDSMLEEGQEEVVQGIIERGLQNVVYNQRNPLASVEDPRAILNPRTAWEEFKGGAVVGGILGAGQTAIQSGINAYAQAQNRKQLNSMRDTRLQNIQQTPQNVTETPPEDMPTTSLLQIIQNIQEEQTSASQPDWVRPDVLDVLTDAFLQGFEMYDSGSTGSEISQGIFALPDAQYNMEQNADALKIILDQINNKESIGAFEEGTTGYDNVGTSSLASLDSSGLANLIQQVYADNLEQPSVGYQFNLNLEDTSNHSQWTETLYNEYVRQMYAGNLENRTEEYRIGLEQEDAVNNTRLAETLYNEYVQQINAGESHGSFEEGSAFIIPGSNFSYESIGTSSLAGLDDSGLADIIQQIYAAQQDQNSDTGQVPVEDKTNLSDIFPPMSEYMNEDETFNLNAAKEDYRKFLKFVPEERGIYLQAALDGEEGVKRFLRGEEDVKNFLQSVPKERIIYAQKDLDGWNVLNSATFIQVKHDNVVFVYLASRDIILFNPKHPKFPKYNFAVSLTHELAHRIDCKKFRSWMKKEFSDAITEVRYAINDDPQKFLAFAKNDHEGFLSDILSAICEDDYRFDAYHEKSYWKEAGNKEREIFANLFSLEAFGDKGKLEFLRKNFPKILDVYNNFFKGGF